MVLRMTLVHEGSSVVAAGDLGVPVTEIVLQDRNGDAAFVPTLSDEDTADVNPTARGDEHAGLREVTARQIIDVHFDGLSVAQKRRIERIRHDGRLVYFTPGFGPNTAACYPLLRSVKALGAGTDLTVTRTEKEYVWDDDDAVFYEFPAGSPAMAFGGPMGRYLRTGFGFVNRASVHHPDSGGVGWALVAGAGAVSYTTDILTPVLALRTHATKKGRARLVGTPGLNAAAFAMSAAGIVASTNHVLGSVVLRGRGSFTITLRDSAGTVIATLGPFVGDGVDHLYKLSGANQSSGTTATMRITLNDTSLAGDANYQEALVAPAFIGNAIDNNASPEIPDWVDTAASDVIAQSTKAFSTAGLTIRFLARFRNWKLGFLEMGDTAKLYLRKLSTVSGNTLEVTLDVGVVAAFPGIGTTPVVLADGDWFHCVVQIDGSDVRCYINGQLHGSSPVGPLVIPANYGPYLRVGGAGSSYLLDGSGMVGLSIDNQLWSAKRVADDYETVLGDGGVGVMQHAAGRRFRIASTSWTSQDGSARNSLWGGSIRLRQQLELTDHAPLQRQEEAS